MTGGRGQCTQHRCRRDRQHPAAAEPAYWSRPTIAPTIPDTRGLGSPYTVRFGPFLFRVETAAKLLTKDEAHRIAANMAKLPMFAQSPHSIDALFSDSLIPNLNFKCPILHTIHWWEGGEDDSTQGATYEDVGRVFGEGHYF